MTDTSTFGSGLGTGGDNPPTMPMTAPDNPIAPQAAAPQEQPTFGSALQSVSPFPNYRAPDPAASALDQTADTLQQRIKRANEVATNPLLQFFNPDGVQKARDFIPTATEQLQKIRGQKAGMEANRVQAQTLGLAPGEVADEATMADRVEVAKSKALKGDLNVFKGLMSVDPKTAEAIAPQVHEVVAGHLDKAQYAFDSLAGMQNQGQYAAKLQQLRKDGTLTDLEALGLKVPPSYDTFNTFKATEGKALRDARIGVNDMRQRLEERNTYQPMEEKEAKTYDGRLTTAYGDQITNGTWGRNAASGTRGLIVNGAADPRDLGKNFTLATPEQRKAIKEQFDGAVPKEDIDKYRANNRTYQLATTDREGKPLPAGQINTNPNVQQGISEGLASMLRGGSGGANVGLLKIETAKRGAVQGFIDSIISNYAGGVNTLTGEQVKPYLSKLTQTQQRDVLDVLKGYNDSNINDRTAAIAQRAGALGLDTAALGFGSKEGAGAIGDAIEAGRQAQIARMMPNHQAIGAGDGVLQLGAQRPGVGAASLPTAAQPTTQLPGAPPLQTPVQQSQNPPPAPVNQPTPVTVAGQQIAVPLPSGASPTFVQNLQRIESGGEKNPWTAGTKGSSASGAFQFINSTWAANKPPGAPDRAADATPEQQATALANLTTKNANTLSSAGLPVNDTNLYIAHNVGVGGASALLRAAPNADARTVVGEAAAKNNPLFFRGKPTVATVLARYNAEMGGYLDDKNPLPMDSAGSAEQPSFLRRVSRLLSAGISDDPAEKDAAVRKWGNAAVENAPAIGSTAGAIAGSAAGPAGTIAGGAAGGGAGQAFKDYVQGRPQSAAEITKQAALGGVLGVAPAGRPILGTVARVAGASGVEAGADVAQNGASADTVDAGVRGAGAALGGEAFGRALGMVGHKIFNMFAPEARVAVQTAAKEYSDASAVLKSEAPTLPSVNGTGGGPNPKYVAAEETKAKAEQTLKDAGLKPEEAAYAHKVSSESVPRQEAEVGRPGALEQQRVGEEYNALGNELDASTRRVPKTVKSTKNEEMQTLFGVKETPEVAASRTGYSPVLPDGPMSAVENRKVSQLHSELAERAEAEITSPAATWVEKWTQLKDARSELLQAERDALSSTSMGRTKAAEDMRTLADTVRTQQEKIAQYVFGKKDGDAFISRLKVLDIRYRNLMEATNNGDLVKAAALKGEAGREADRKFRAFAHDDPAALAAWTAMRASKGNIEQGVHDLVAAERIPVLGKAFGAVKLVNSLNTWLRERAAGNPVTFSDLIRTTGGDIETGRTLRNVAGTAAQRAAVQGDLSLNPIGSAEAGDLVPHPGLVATVSNPQRLQQAMGPLNRTASDRTNVIPLKK